MNVGIRRSVIEQLAAVRVGSQNASQIGAAIDAGRTGEWLYLYAARVGRFHLCDDRRQRHMIREH